MDETGLGLAADRIAGPAGERDHLRVGLRQESDRAHLPIRHNPRVEHLQMDTQPQRTLLYSVDRNHCARQQRQPSSFVPGCCGPIMLIKWKEHTGDTFLVLLYVQLKRIDSGGSASTSHFTFSECMLMAPIDVCSVPGLQRGASDDGDDMANRSASIRVAVVGGGYGSGP